jgi:8-oxo-dGTP pyrophosphatase MutT (NUDIX family)
VSLPGGAVDPGEDIEQCALREAWEELGILPDAVRVIGRLTPVYIPPSDFLLYPVVGWADARPEFKLHPDEVDAILEVRLDWLTAPGAWRAEDWAFDDGPRRVVYYPSGPHKVWGATAFVLHELAAIWDSIADPIEPGNE